MIVYLLLSRATSLHADNQTLSQLSQTIHIQATNQTILTYTQPGSQIRAMIVMQATNQASAP